MRNLRLAFTITSVTLAGLGFRADALPNVSGKSGVPPEKKALLKTTAATCSPASATIDLDINNVRARLMTGGDMWWDIGTGTARYEVPKGSHKHSLFAGSVWVGGYDDQKNLKVAAQSYRQNGNDYWPGPLNITNTTDKNQCSDWDRFWKVNKSDILAFREIVRSGSIPEGSQYDVIKEWPASGNGDAMGVSGGQLSVLIDPAYKTRTYAPFVDVNGDGVYDWRHGDYPDVLGDQYIWWVFNDAGNAKLESQTGAIGMEVQASAFGFSSQDYVNDATFYNYKLINRGNTSLNETYMSTWTDADLGYAFDDYIGCDTTRSLGILYNGRSVDGNGEVNSYGSEVPMVGVDFFIGPKRKRTTPTGIVYDTLGMTVFNYFNNDFSPIGNPTGGIEIYNVMSGFSRRGVHLHDDFAQGTASTGFGPGALTNFVFPGNPNNNGEWSECTCNKNPGDRRFVHSSGPFILESGGVTNDVTIGAVWVSDVGGCPNTSFTKIRAADDQAQNLFDNHFKAIEGPQAPRLITREMDRKIIFYLVNDSNSNNFQEKFGYDTAAKYHVSTAQTRKYADSLYKFEGYRVFQLKNSTITPAQIFGEDHQVNKEVASEVFQCDIKNGVTKIVNYVGNPDKGPNVYDAAIKVIGRDSGIVHSFELANDAFATGNDKRFVNYRNYYFVAIAYSYNNFRAFTYTSPDSSQQVPYLESNKAAGETNIKVVVAMPNPANGDMGTVLNADYGSGVVIKREEGVGNGHNSIQMDSASEALALSAPGYFAPYPTYVPGMGPVNVKVIDPRNLKPLDWELHISGTVPPLLRDSAKGIYDTTGSWKLIAIDGAIRDTIYAEGNLRTVNEQILEKYGLSVEVHQVLRPGDDQINGNGYIGSNIVYADPGKIWLAGVVDGEQHSYQNWIRSGKNHDPTTPVLPCNWDDNARDTVLQVYETLFLNNGLNKGTWAPYSMTAVMNSGACGFGVAYSSSSQLGMGSLPSVDVVFTSDKSKWTRCPVIEMQDDASLAQRKANKFTLRGHASWNLGLDNNGFPVYATAADDTGMSWFPGYAINQETGERLNIVFSEDSYQKNQNGADMIWNPTSNIIDDNANVLFGGKHYVYVLSTRYDEGRNFVDNLASGQLLRAYQAAQWVGLTTITRGISLLPLKDGLIPTETRLRMRVDKPYAVSVPVAGQTLKNGGLPVYSFNTRDIAARKLSDGDNPYNSDKQALLDMIRAVPNPYYGYTGYETNRLDTRVRIVNLPRKATVSIYSLDGSLVRRLEKDNPNVSYVDWDIRNAKGLQVASGMYLMHVNAEGIGETVLRWFGSLRPTDITTY